MDKKQLEIALETFRGACKEKGHPIDRMCLDEAYPGVFDSSYNLQISAGWTHKLSCWESIDFLFDVLFETTSADVRKCIFMIQITDALGVTCQSEVVEKKIAS